MLEAILLTLKLMGWLGIVLGILVAVNTISGSIVNIWSGAEPFSWRRLYQGILKSVIFYISAVFLGVAFTMLPFINEMITGASGEMLLSSEMLSTLSSVGVLGVIVSVIIIQSKKAIENILKLANLSTSVEKITWDVILDEEEEK